MENYKKDGVPVIKNQKELRILIKKAQQGCENSKNDLVESNLNLVRSITKRYRQHQDYEDLMQVGIIGLIKSIQNFDLSLNVCFSTYAVPVILGEVKRYFRDYKMVKVSRQIQENLVKIKKFVDGYQLEKSEEPRISDIVKGTQIDEGDVILAIGSEKGFMSLDKPLGDEDGKMVTLLDALQDETDYFNQLENKELISSSIDKLNMQEKRIIIARYMLERTQTELAEELGMSQAHVSRIEKKALKKIKEIV